MIKHLIVLAILFTSCYDCDRINELERPKYLIATIDTSYRDINNRNIPIVKLISIKTNMKIDWIDGSELIGIYKYGEKGDTVIKNANSLEYKLIKKDTMMSFYPICNGREIR